VCRHWCATRTWGYSSASARATERGCSGLVRPFAFGRFWRRERQVAPGDVRRQRQRDARAAHKKGPNGNDPPGPQRIAPSHAPEAQCNLETIRIKRAPHLSGAVRAAHAVRGLLCGLSMASAASVPRAPGCRPRSPGTCGPSERGCEWCGREGPPRSVEASGALALRALPWETRGRELGW
jgi:hypothetical protein